MAYTVPDAATLKTRYPAFADVADATVDYWIEDAQRIVTERWAEADYAPGLMALAAHNMSRNGVLAPAAGQVPSMEQAISAISDSGLTSFRSGSFSAQMSDEAAKVSLAGGYASTRYGQEFEAMLRRNVGPGVRVVSGSGAPGLCGWPGRLPSW